MASITHSTTRAADRADANFGLVPRLLLASLSLAAGGIHLAMAPIHASESATEAVGFAVVGWAQIILAIALLFKPNRPVLAFTMALNVAVIGAYIFSRTVGLPFGAHPGEAESVEAIDLMVTVFEGILVAGAALLFIRPDLSSLGEGRVFSFESVAAAAAFPLIVLAASSVALADPDLASHGHDDGALASSTGGGGHAHGGAAAPVDSAQLASLAEDRCDLKFNPVAYWRETSVAGVDTLAGGTVALTSHEDAAAVQGSVDLDKLISKQMTVKGESGDAEMVVALSQVSDDVYDDWLRWLKAAGLTSHAHESSTAPDDNQGMGGHLGPQAWHAMTNQDDCDKLEEEIALARDTALKYRTVADAKAAGYFRITGYVPGIAAHYIKGSIMDGTFNIEEPEMLLYDGTEDNAQIVGLSYYLIHPGTAEPTQGFSGPNDHYHRHDGLCIGRGGVIGDSTTTKEDCEARGGRKADGTAGWMSHAWVVPGCESPWGVFSAATPILDTALTQASGSDGGGCAGSGVRDRYDLTAGDVGNTPKSVGGSLELAAIVP